jgi:hypothetical protein
MPASNKIKLLEESLQQAKETARHLLISVDHRSIFFQIRPMLKNNSWN